LSEHTDNLIASQELKSPTLTNDPVQTQLILDFGLPRPEDMTRHRLLAGFSFKEQHELSHLEKESWSASLGSRTIISQAFCNFFLTRFFLSTLSLKILTASPLPYLLRRKSPMLQNGRVWKNTGKIKRP
jgi:hypothetical protein